MLWDLLFLFIWIITLHLLMKQNILYLASLADISKDFIFLRLICLDLRVHYSRHLFSRWPLTHTGENQTWRGFKVLKSKSNSDTLITQKHIIWYFVPHREPTKVLQHLAFNVHFAMWQHVGVYREQSVVFQFNFLRCDLNYLGVLFHHRRFAMCLPEDLHWVLILRLRFNDLKKI